MNDGHMTPLAVLRHSPMFMQRSAAARMPPSAKLSRVATAGAGPRAGSRRCSVMAGASTILPGFMRPSGSNTRLTSRIASYRGSPNTRRLNSLRASPSPCSLELAPPYSATSSSTSSATARMVPTSAGLVRSRKGRTCRQPTEQCP
jgi:hypothetical protein